MTEPQILGLNEEVESRPFTSPTHYPADAALLNYLLHDLRTLMRRYVRGEASLTPYKLQSWSVHDLARRIIVCDPDALTQQDEVQFVGFFGDRRQQTAADPQLLDEMDDQLIAGFPQHANLLSYSSIELVDNFWANLVVHRAAEDREGWRNFDVHKRAVKEIAPDMYHSVRIHNGRISNGIGGEKLVEITNTKYWDYDVEPVWRATRHIDGAA